MRRPAAMHSIRARVALRYSVVVFLLGGSFLAAMYVAARDAVHTRVTSDREPARVDVEERLDEQARDDLVLVGAVGAVLLFVGSVATGWMITARALAPVDRIVGVAREIGLGDLRRRIAHRGTDDELGRLADTFDAMLARLEREVTARRRLLDEISHDLRNPLATMATTLDVLLRDRSLDGGELRSRLRGMRSTVDHVERLIERLLDERTSAPGVAVDVAAICGDVVEALAAGRAPRARLTVRAQAIARVDPAALRRALFNLVDNATRAAGPAGWVKVEVDVREGCVFVAVADSGWGIPEPRRRAALGERAASAAEAVEAAHGLGLAIAVGLVRAAGGEVRIPARARPTRVEVWLPAAG